MGLRAKSRRKPQTKAGDYQSFERISEAYKHYEKSVGKKKLGIATFYAETGDHYRNPHEEKLLPLLVRALAEWEGKGFLSKSGREAAPPLGRVLDLGCGSGEASLGLLRWAAGRPGVAAVLDAADPYTFDAYERRTGRRAQRWRFEDVASKGVLDDLPPYDAVMCSYCLHIPSIPWRFATLTALARASRLLIVASPDARPEIRTDMRWTRLNEMSVPLKEPHEIHNGHRGPRISVRLYSSLDIPD